MINLTLTIPPPIVGLLSAVGMFLIKKYTDLLPFSLKYQSMLAFAFIVVGFILAVLAAIHFKLDKTTLSPLKPQTSSVLAQQGGFKISRNPMYLGMLFVLLGWGCYLGNVASLLFLPLFVVYMNKFQIKPEEACLRELFGHQYIQYQQKVRRWL